MRWPRDLVLVRHAESVGNVLSADERASFTTSTHKYGLTSRGMDQALTTGKYLREKYGEFDHYYVSYYERSRQTMKLMYPDAKVYEDPRLAEAQRGIYHAMTKSEIEAKYPEELIRKDREGLYHYRPPGGENWPDVELRIHSFLGTLARDYADQRILMVVHGHWLLLYQRLIHRTPIDACVEDYLGKKIFANASVTHYSGNHQGRLEKKCENVVPWENPAP